MTPFCYLPSSAYPDAHGRKHCQDECKGMIFIDSLWLTPSSWTVWLQPKEWWKWMEMWHFHDIHLFTCRSYKSMNKLVSSTSNNELKYDLVQFHRATSVPVILIWHKIPHFLIVFLKSLQFAKESDCISVTSLWY